MEIIFPHSLLRRRKILWGLSVKLDMRVSQNWGVLFGGLHIKDYSILGSILGYPNFGKVPHEVRLLSVV